MPEDGKDGERRASTEEVELKEMKTKEEGECEDVSDGGEGSPLEKQSLVDRLLAISASSAKEKVADRDRGKWLKEQMDEFKKINEIHSDEEPTNEEIILQIKLPGKEMLEKKEFKDPLKNWVPVEKSGVPSWRKESLLNEEWSSCVPPGPGVERSLQEFTNKFEEETHKLPKISGVVKDKNIALNEDLSDDDEVVLFNNLCIIRTTKAGIKKSIRDRQKEEEEEEREFRGKLQEERGGGHGRRGNSFVFRGRDRFGGKENRGRGFMNRSISSSHGRNARLSYGHDGGDRGFPSHGSREDGARRQGGGREDGACRQGSGRVYERRDHYSRHKDEKKSGGRRERYSDEKQRYSHHHGGRRDDGGREGQHTGRVGCFTSPPATYQEYKARKAAGSGR